jgi:hypothetical protein
MAIDCFNRAKQNQQDQLSTARLHCRWQESETGRRFPLWIVADSRGQLEDEIDRAFPLEECDDRMEVEEQPVTPVSWSCMNSRRDLIEHCLMDKDKIQLRRNWCCREK